MEGFFPHNYQAPPVIAAPKCAADYSTADVADIQAKLDIKLDKTEVKQRANGNGMTVHYLEGWRAIQLANECFGFRGWTSQILSLTTDFVLFPDSPNTREPRISGQGDNVIMGMTCVIRVTLRDGTFHEDVGCGQAEGPPRKLAMLFEKCRKEAVTDALKRTLRTFGNRLGNCAYDREFGKLIALQSKPPPPNGTLRHLPTNPLNGHRNNVGMSGVGKRPFDDSVNRNEEIPELEEDENRQLMNAEPPSDYVPKWTNAKSLLSPLPTLPVVPTASVSANLPSDFFCDDDFGNE
jgi:DNA repair and recombination protein RAD52